MNPSNFRTCAGSCGRMTRPPRAHVADYRDTVLRYRGDECKVCYMRAGRQTAHPYTIAGLESFLRRRRDREAVMVRREMCTR